MDETWRTTLPEPPDPSPGRTIRAPSVMTRGADADRVAIFDQHAGGPWMVTRITVQCDTVDTKVLIYAGDPRPHNLITGTRHGDFDECDPFNPYYLGNGVPLTVVWADGTPASCFARVEWTLTE